MAVSISIDKVQKTFGSVQALRDISLEITPGELFFLLGPSGCGKTTLLRCIAGFHRPDSGRVLIGDQDVTTLPPHVRDTGMMFQSYALWPHMTIEQNVAFGLEMRKTPRSEIRRRVGEALELVHLSDRAKARPGQLSGGQQQRVALARALVIRPRCLLLDEPLSNLDAKLRLEMRSEIRRVCKQAGLTAVYVTHDQKEALSVADRLAILRGGILEQSGTPEEVYRQPSNRFVAGFIGEGNFVAGRIAGLGAGGARIHTALGDLHATHVPAGSTPGTNVTLCLRPEALRLGAPAPGAGINVLQGRHVDTVYLGEVAQHRILMQATVPGLETFFTTFELNPAPGSCTAGADTRLWISPEQVIVTKEERERQQEQR